MEDAARAVRLQSDSADMFCVCSSSRGAEWRDAAEAGAWYSSARVVDVDGYVLQSCSSLEVSKGREQRVDGRPAAR